METAQLWNSVFGSVWETLIKSTPEIGGFLLDNENKTAMTDKNALVLLKLNAAPDYTELSELINSLSEENGNGVVSVLFSDKNDKYAAGIVKLTSSLAKFSENLPVRSYTYLVTSITQGARDSLLALIQIEEFGNPSLDGIDIGEVLAAILAEAPSGTILSAAARNRFWLYIPDYSDDKIQCLKHLQDAVCKFGLDGAEPHHLTFTAGCGADVALVSQRMQAAEFTLFEAAAKGTGTILTYSDERFEQQKNEYEKMRRFTRLIDNNLFQYHFQPIVSARNGDIIAYEALMRTDKSIGMNPFEILTAAEKLGKMYEIEKATISNTLKYLSDNQASFVNKRLFVNSIPAYMLTDDDWNALVHTYGELMEKVVIEMTEQTEMEDDKFEAVRERLKRSNIALAIDDFGAGYSSPSNLLRYNPDFVKIDRSLIQDINSKPKVQKFVSGIIEFIHENGYSVLAEGVETHEELKTMIQLGSDLIQGYYISMPKPFTLHEITDTLREEINAINLVYSKNITKVYHPENGEIVELSKLAAEHYGTIYIDAEDVTIEGDGKLAVNCPIIIKDGLKSTVTLKNVVLTTDKDNPIISLGVESDIDMVLVGDNFLNSRGIWVPQSASLKLCGCGSLSIKVDVPNAYGIGVDKDNSPGNIVFECTGKIYVESNGEDSVAIGGGKNKGGTAIRVLAGALEIQCGGGNCIGIGNFDGNSVIDFTNSSCAISISASNAVAIGSLNGKTDIFMENYKADIVLSGLSLCGLGSMNDGEGIVYASSGTINCDMHGRTICCVGSYKGNVNCTVKSSMVNLYCEGNSSSGIGDIAGGGDIAIKECSVEITFRVKEGIGLGSKTGSLRVENTVQDIRISE